MRRVIRMRDLATTKSYRGHLPVSPATVWRWVAAGKFPAPFKMGANVTVWDAEQVEQFLTKIEGATRPIACVDRMGGA